MSARVGIDLAWNEIGFGVSLNLWGGTRFTVVLSLGPLHLWAGTEIIG